MKTASISEAKNGLANLVRKGIVRRAKRKGVPEFLLRPPIPLPVGVSVVTALLGERSESR